MKSSLCFVLSSIVVLLLSGCSTPSKVTELSLQTRRASEHMAAVHEQDLQALAAYDRARVCQFNRLLAEYFSLRTEVVNKFNEALNNAKRASMAELDHAFDERAEQFLAVDFWTAFRQTADKELNIYLLKHRDSVITKVVGSDGYRGDPTQRDKAFLEARQLYLDSALKYQVIEGQFAFAVDGIRKAREEYHNANEKLFASIEILRAPGASNDLAGFVLTNNAGQIEHRISQLESAYAKIDDANALLMRYLNENNLPLDFFIGVGTSLGLVGGVSTNVPSSTLATAPDEPATSVLPGLSGLAASFTDKLKAVAEKKGEGASKLENALTKVLALADRPIPIPSGVSPAANLLEMTSKKQQ